MTIFSVVMSLAASTLLVLIDANSKAQSKQAVLNNLSLAIDSMTREIRTGYGYHCATYETGSRPSPEDSTSTQDCTDGGNFIAFTESGDSLTEGTGSDRVAYYFDEDENQLQRRVGTGSWIPLTATNVIVTDAAFIVRHTDTYRDTDDIEQPTVTVYIRGEAGEVPGLDTSFEVQTSVTQRSLDI